jgi:hypothetical protein
MKTSSIILLAVALTIGCSKKSDPAPSSSITACLLTKSTLNKSSNTISYNSSNQPTSIVIATDDGTGTVNSNTYNITLDASGRITKLTNTGTPVGFAFSSIEFTYSGSNTYPLSAKLNSPDGSYIQGTSTFNSSNQLTQTVSAFFDKSLNTTTNSYTTYSYPTTSTKNPSKKESFNGLPGAGGDKFSMNEYTYDDKNLPNDFLNLYAGNATTNNILTDKQTFSPGTVSESVSTQTFTYQYNSKGYPTQRSYQLLGSTVTEFYIYSNCN